MTEHLDDDRLVSIGSAMDWQVDHALDHHRRLNARGLP